MSIGDTVDDLFMLFACTNDSADVEHFELILSNRFNAPDFLMSDLVFDIRTGLNNLINQDSNTNLT
jgi:hypothetical protein